MAAAAESQSLSPEELDNQGKRAVVVVTDETRQPIGSTSFQVADELDPDTAEAIVDEINNCVKKSKAIPEPTVVRAHVQKHTEADGLPMLGHSDVHIDADLATIANVARGNHTGLYETVGN